MTKAVLGSGHASHIIVFFFFFFNFIFKLYITVLVLPNIKMNPILFKTTLK